jgi:transposase-like protein
MFLTQLTPQTKFSRCCIIFVDLHLLRIPSKKQNKKIGAKVKKIGSNIFSKSNKNSLFE